MQRLVARVVSNMRVRYFGQDWILRTDILGAQETLFITFTAEDTRKHDSTHAFTFTFVIPELDDEQAALAWVTGKCEKLALHEMQESVRYKGGIAFDPHKGGKNRVLRVDTSRICTHA